jgi:undecaprenyl-diphosphatase
MGAVQGLTEFLPISSSGHLVLVQQALDGTTDPVFVLLLHIATLLAVVIYFWEDVVALLRSFVGRDTTKRSDLLYPLIIGTAPAAIAGLLFESSVDKAFDSEGFVALALVITGLLLIVAARLPKGERSIAMLEPRRAAIIGLFQAFALFPGISRSGSTIVGGICNKLAPKEAARFSFLLSIPAIGGATLLKLSDIASYDTANTIPYVLGMAIAFVSGFAGIRVLMRAVTQGKLEYFGYYCIAIALVVIALIA